MFNASSAVDQAEGAIIGWVAPTTICAAPLTRAQGDAALESVSDDNIPRSKRCATALRRQCASSSANRATPPHVGLLRRYA